MEWYFQNCKDDECNLTNMTDEHPEDIGGCPESDHFRILSYKEDGQASYNI